MVAIVSQTSSNSLSVTIPSTTAGNTLIVCVASFNATAQASISGVTLGGSAGNFAQAVTPGHGASGGNFSDAFIWVDPNCAGGQTAVAISGSNLDVTSGNGGVRVFQVSGLATSLPVDKTSTGGGASGATFDSGSTATTTQAVEFWAGVAATLAPGSPVGWTNTTIGGGAIAGQQITSATGIARYTASQSSTTWAAVVATFLPVSSGINVNLALGTVAVAGLSVLASPLNVNLARGQIAVAGLAVTPRVAMSAALAAGTVTVRGFAVTAKVTKNLILSIASDAGIDPVTGASYPIGFTNFDPTNAQNFVNLIDQRLSVFFTGQTNIGGLFMDTPGAYTLLSGQNVPGDSESEINIFSGSASGLGGIGLIQILADNIQLLNAGQNIPNPHIFGFPVSGAATLGTTITALNNLYNALVNLGLISL